MREGRDFDVPGPIRCLCLEMNSEGKPFVIVADTRRRWPRAEKQTNRVGMRCRQSFGVGGCTQAQHRDGPAVPLPSRAGAGKDGARSEARVRAGRVARAGRICRR